MVAFMHTANLMVSVNPATGERLAEVPAHTSTEAGDRLVRCREAFRAWSRRPVDERAPVLARAGALVRKRRDELARLATLEMGKTIVAAEAEVEKCAWVCDHYAANAAEMLAPEQVATDASDSHVRFDPLGVVLAIMPWNFPYWQAFRAAVPALAAGNTLALKHASNVTGCALAMERLWRDAGLPEDAFTVILVQGAEASALAAHTAVSAVTLTGSEAAGASVGAIAGRALKKVVLELGGSDPFIVLADADVAHAARQAAAARVINNGESCIAAKRFIVVESVAEAFEEALAESLRALRVGDPLDRATDVGPLARPDLVDELERQIERSLAKGAQLVLGGRRLQGPGNLFPPTLLTRVSPGMPAFDEETFGPLAAVTRARDAGEALSLANRSRYGLGASLWTADVEAARELAAKLEAGAVFVNATVRSDPRLPFGGIKRSGHGRELGRFGIREFVNVKTVWVA